MPNGVGGEFVELVGDRIEAVSCRNALVSRGRLTQRHKGTKRLKRKSLFSILFNKHKLRRGV